MNTWHKCTVKYTKQLTDGTLKRVNEEYLFNAINFTEVESRAFEEIGEFVRGEFLVTSIASKNISDIFQYDDSETWFEGKISYTSEDLDSGKEKRVNNLMLVSANNIKEAYERFEESLKGLMVSYEIESIKKSKVLEIFPYKPSEVVSEEE